MEQSTEPRPITLRNGPHDGYRMRVRGQPPEIRQPHSVQTAKGEWMDMVARYGRDPETGFYIFVGYDK